MTELLLTDDELTALTGYRIARGRIQVLTRNRIPYTLDRYGRPVVRRDWNTAGAPKREFQLGEVS